MNDTFENSLDLVLAELRSTLLKKHADYGPKNILKFKDVGVLVRLSDKLARMENLYGIDDNSYRAKTASNESIGDTWLDIAGYGLIGLMLNKNIFDCPVSKESGAINISSNARFNLTNKSILDKRATETDRVMGIIVAAAKYPYESNPHNCIADVAKFLEDTEIEFVERVIEKIRYQGENK